MAIEVLPAASTKTGGGGGDAEVSRLLLQPFSKDLGKVVVVEADAETAAAASETAIEGMKDDDVMAPDEAEDAKMTLAWSAWLFCIGTGTISAVTGMEAAAAGAWPG